MTAPSLVTDLLDLVLARACLACDEPGRVLCAACLARRRGQVRQQVLPSGLLVSAAVDYDDVGRELVLAYKEHGTRALAPMLGTLLADAVTVACGTAAVRRVALVPVPAHRASRRGFDALGTIVRHARSGLHDRGLRAVVMRPVRSARRSTPLKTLGREARRRAVVDAFALAPSAARRAAASGQPVVLVDDVVTTGATLERMGALVSAAGLSVVGAAAVASVSPGRPAPTPVPAPPTSPP